MAMASIDLGDADVWDDSALVASWDAAAEEYKKYHSVHARGEKVEDVLNEYELAQLQQEHRQQNRASGAAADAEDGEEEGEEAYDEEDGYNDPQYAANQPSNGNEYGLHQQVNYGNEGLPSFDPAAQYPPVAPGLAALPQAVLGQGSDEALKNVLMAWYYAGYYTGLYEGRQQGVASASASAAAATASRGGHEHGGKKKPSG